MTFILKPNPIYDVYEGEYPIKWDQMNPAPALAILKASGKFFDGTRRQDRQVETYAAQCRSLSIRIGLYHFLLPNSIAEQAQLFVDVWNKLGGADIPPILDVEVSNLDSFGIGQEVWADQIKSCLDYVEGKIGLKPIIYTSINYWPYTYSKTPSGSLVPPEWAKDYDVWAAWYPYYPDNFEWIPDNAVPKGLKRCVLWQYNNKGRSHGFLANDLNIASPEFLEEIQSNPISSGTIGGSTMFNYQIIPTGEYVNLRPNHDTSQPAIRSIQKTSKAYGNEVWGDGINEYWLHVIEIDGIVVNGWAASKSVAKTFATITKLNDTGVDTVSLRSWNVVVNINGQDYTFNG